MGVGSDGIFFFGMIWTDNDPPWRPADKKEIEIMKDELSTNPEWEDLYCMRSEKDINDCKVQIGFHCNGEDPMYFLAVSETLVTANRGYPSKVKTVLVKPEWRSELKQFCDWMGIKFQEPAWWVTSILG